MQPDILLVVLDTARAQTLLPDRSKLMPNLFDELTDGVVFTNAIANAPWTLPSHASMFSGQYPAHHGAYARGSYFETNEPTIAEIAKQQGYQTAAFSNNPWISPAFGFSDGFDFHQMGWELFPDAADLSDIGLTSDSAREKAVKLTKELFKPSGPKTLANAAYMRLRYQPEASGAKNAVKHLERWLAQEYDPETPTFTFLNFMETHLEYVTPPEYQAEFLPEDVSVDEAAEVNQDPWSYVAGEREMSERELEILHALYRAAFRYVDEQLEAALNYWDEYVGLDETLLIVTGDHGEHIGDRGLMDHQYSLSQSVVRVPLALKGPRVPAVTETDALVELRDIYPTIVKETGANLPANESISSRGLIDVTKSRDGRSFAVSEYPAPQPTINSLESRVGELDEEKRRQLARRLKAIQSTSGEKLILDDAGGRELYDLSKDPTEQTNVAAQNPDVVAELEDVLGERVGQWASETIGGGHIDSGTEARLEDLGYI